MFTKLRSAIDDALLAAKLKEYAPGMALGGLVGGTAGYLTGDEDDEISRALIYALGGAAAGRLVPGINEAATEFSDAFAEEILPKLKEAIK